MRDRLQSNDSMHLQSDSYLRLLLDSTATAFYAVDTEGTTTHCNQAFLDMLGFPDTVEVIGHKLHNRIHHLYPDGVHYPVEQCPIYNGAKDGSSSHTTNEWFYRIDGTPIPVEYSVYPLVKDGKHLGAICTFIDISDRIQSETALRESEKRFRFLSQLDEATRAIHDATRIMEITTRLLGEYMHVSRCAYADVENDGDMFTIRQDYCAPGHVSTVGVYSLDLFGSDVASNLRAGDTIILRDIAKELPSDDGAGMFHAIGINALICCPLVKEGQLKAMMAVHQAEARDWSADEIRLVKTVVERCWAHIERIHSREELKESEQRVRLIINTALDAVVMTDADGIITEWNKHAELMFGWTHDEAIGAQMREMIIPPAYRAMHEAGMQRFLATGEARILNTRVEITALNKRGEIFPIELTVTAQQSKGKTYFTAFARDITERVQAQEKLRESEEQFRQLANSITQLAWMTDETGWISWYNQRWYNYTGTTFEEMQGWGWQKVHDPRELDRIMTTWTEALATGEPFQDTFPLRRYDGEMRWHLTRAQPIKNDQGKIIRWFGTNTDITDQREAAKAAEAANIAKSEFLANMSHEIRTPMNAVIGLSNILSKSEPLTPKQKEFVKTLQMSADSLLSLINDLLDIAKVEARSVELEHIPFSVVHLVQETVSMMNVRAVEKGLTFKVLQECACIEKRKMLGDPTRIRQILLNLCSNALKFTEQGGIFIHISCTPADDPTREVITISVEDTGIGIPADKIGDIFYKFTQADSSINRKYGGTGLGLAITKTLAEIMGGTVEVKSEPGKGSTFSVTLPLEIALNEQVDVEVQAALRDTEASSRGRILLVEDYAPNVMVATAFLEEFGYAVDVSTHGRDAIEKVIYGAYVLVLMDVQMPGLNGLQATQLIREYEKLKQLPPVPIMGMTAHALAGDRERCLSMGMDDYISKPFNPAELENKIATLLRK